METLSLVIGSITLSVLVWAVIENVFFVKRVLVNSKGCSEKSRKITKNLFVISLLLAAVMIFICFCLFNTSFMSVEFVNYIVFFFFSFPFLVVLWMIIELILMLISSIRKQKQGGDDEQVRKSKNIFPILAVYLVVTIILCFVFGLILVALSTK
ncbi:MAG: hypothetical protein K2J77_12585 [Oscillospiraceae bacterium]|nr:hypothetical protein [Oscillospiraceae bacterium]